MDYSKYSKTVQDKLSQYGNTMYIIRKGEEVYNPDTNEYEGEEIRIKGLGLLSNYSIDHINGTSILNGDVNIMAYFTEKVFAGDVIEYGDKKYTVITVRELNPNGMNAIYYLIQGR